MKRTIKTYLLTIVCLCFFSCYESPQIDFLTYQELSGYNFISNRWFPDLLGADSYNILETYDLNNSHAFGKFEFKQRVVYDSIIRNYYSVNADTLLSNLNKIGKPRYPAWFIPKAEISGRNYTMAKQNNFWLLMDRKSNRIYFFR